jgi:predicted esterase
MYSAHFNFHGHMCRQLPIQNSLYSCSLSKVLIAATMCLLICWDAAAANSSAGSATVIEQQAPVEPVEVIDFDWRDTERNRTVPARLYWPVQLQTQTQTQTDSARVTQGHVPLVVFSHGMGGSRMGYSHLGRHWAELGFASLHLQHLGSDREVWRDAAKSIFSLLTTLRAAASEEQAIARAKDVSFGISMLLSNEALAKRIDRNAIAVAGHSYGANTALLVAGAQVQRNGEPLSLRDDRVKAAIILSAPPFHGEGDMQPILQGIAIPTLHVTGTKDNISIPGYSSTPDDRVDVYNATGGPRKWLAVFKDGTHSIFTDRIDRAGFELNQIVKKATRELTAAFLRAALKGDEPQAVQRWLEAHDALMAARQSKP